MNSVFLMYVLQCMRAMPACSGSTASAQQVSLAQMLVLSPLQSDGMRLDDSSGFQPTIESQVCYFCC